MQISLKLVYTFSRSFQLKIKRYIMYKYYETLKYLEYFNFDGPDSLLLNNLFKNHLCMHS